MMLQKSQNNKLLFKLARTVTTYTIMALSNVRGACTIVTIKTNTIQLDKSGNLEKAYGIKKNIS